VKTITASAAKNLGRFLTRDFRKIFGPGYDEIAERLGSLARSTIECLGRSDALYHNLEHTFLVTLVATFCKDFHCPIELSLTTIAISSAPASCMTSDTFEVF
jgi:hypothetical protein